MRKFVSFRVCACILMAILMSGCYTILVSSRKPGYVNKVTKVYVMGQGDKGAVYLWSFLEGMVTELNKRNIKSAYYMPSATSEETPAEIAAKAYGYGPDLIMKVKQFKTQISYVSNNNGGGGGYTDLASTLEISVVETVTGSEVWKGTLRVRNYSGLSYAFEKGAKKVTKRLKEQGVIN